ncbi:EVE domain-containing protein [Lacihabitans lacunae]|uniref:EVE domain-containing protein n=1 Tax=Lacihabitans lacunae TaxID=1028214 RepID=A0ABV7YVK3_9BACT
MNYWLVKSEPDTYSWDFFVSKGRDIWDGVRNYQARNNLKAMSENDLVFFYHSNKGMEIVGLAKVVKESYQDPTTEDPRWVVVELAPVKKLAEPVSLTKIKTDPNLSDISLLKQSRLSVMPIKPEEFDRIMYLANEV